MSKRNVGRLSIALFLLASGCTTQGVSLRGFFGDPVVDVPQVRELIESSILPPSWDRGVPLVDYPDPHKPLYLDSSLDPEANDTQKDVGLENSTLAFYVGHGAVDFWTDPDVPPNDRVELARVKAGDELLRYFWLYSCNLLAHGPEVNRDFPLPHRFQSGQVDAFQRWTSAFGLRLRMVCGGSTQLGSGQVVEIWDHLFGAQTSVPDAFVLGVAQPNQVPVCLARGGPHPVASALSDRTLHPAGLAPSGPNWLHLQMPVTCKVTHEDSTLQIQCGGEPPISPAALDDPPAPAIETLPVVTTTALPPPVPIEGGRLPLGFERLAGDDSKYHRDSGAIVLIKRRDRYSPLDRCDQQTKWVVNPWALLEQSRLAPGLLPPTSPDADGLRKLSDMAVTALEMRVESRQDGSPPEERKCWLRSLFLRFDTEVDIGMQRLPIFGPGITIELQRGETPVLASFSAPHRELTVSAAPPVPIKPAETAIGEAQHELQLDPETYPISAARAILGYEEAPLHCRQKFLRPTYEIRFVSTTPDHPTVIVRRDARLDSSEASWECQGWDGERSPSQP